MAYRSYSRNPRRTYRVTTGRVGRVNSRPDACRSCKEIVPAGGGELYRETDGAWAVVHLAAEWTGSPVSGFYSGGCPDETDKMNSEGRFGGPDGVKPERSRIAGRAATHTGTQG